MTWQPIETAPKNETVVWLSDGEAVYQGFYNGTPNYFDEVGWYDAEFDRNNWYSEHPLEPTHWMPIQIPEPPK
jgi:hypothetical protein